MTKRIDSFECSNGVQIFDDSFYATAKNVTRFFKETKLDYLERENSATEFSNFEFATEPCAENEIDEGKITKIRLEKFEKNL